ncbi:MAG: InlB B-repeat-containing protein [Clostridia bacterium]|nr:InlB B-repeat-containing protein [Clostridia bacterium]
MKRKLLVLICAMVAAVTCLIGLVACGGTVGGSGGGVNGTYYPYENGSYDKTAWIKLNGDTWTTNDGDSGTFEVKGNEIVIYIDLYGSKQIFSKGTVKDGVLTMTTAGITRTFCKDGAKPSDSSQPNKPNNPVTEKVTITYNANGGRFASGSETYSQTADKNALLTAPDSPTRTNYTFAGWSKSKSGSDMWKFDEDKASDGITLYAKWTEKSAVILSVDGASIEGNNIFMLVDHTTDAVSLSNKVVCSSDSVWRLYYDRLGQTEIPTKMAAGLSGYLANGNNVFYMVVTSQDGVQTNLYELTVHRSYAVSVSYYNGFALMDTETVYTGSTFTANYNPTITGYTFNGWKDADGVAVTSFTVWGSTSLYANKTAKSYTASFNVNGGDKLTKTEQTVTYDSSYKFPVPTRTGYSFLGWYYGETQLTNTSGSSIVVWNYTQDRTINAKWQANTYTLTVKTNNSDAGTVTGGGEYKYDSSVTLTATTTSGCMFLGWYDINEDCVSQELSFRIKMGFDKTYVAKWDTNIRYIDSNGEIKYNSSCKYLTKEGNQTLSGWYLLSGTVSGEFTFTVINEAHIILADNCSWNLNSGGLVVSSSNLLYIYAQSIGENVGELKTNANIGGQNSYGFLVNDNGENGGNGGTITINGGKITATNIGGGNGGKGRDGGTNSDGITGHYGAAGGAGGTSGTITINGGEITSTNIGGGNGGNGGNGGYGSARGGSGGSGGSGGNGGTIMINGGKITAINIGGGNGGNGGNGESCGDSGNGGNGGPGGRGGTSGTITINGGEIASTNIGGGNGGNGGNGNNSGSGQAGGYGSGGGAGGTSGTITINGGEIVSTNIGGGNGGNGGNGGYGGAGISGSPTSGGAGGNGGNGGSSDTITINAGIISAANLSGGNGGNGGNGKAGSKYTGYGGNGGNGGNGSIIIIKNEQLTISSLRGLGGKGGNSRNGTASPGTAGTKAEIYFYGTESEWNSKEISSENADIYFYSKNEPSVEGNYWHYDENGEIAIWVKEQ